MARKSTAASKNALNIRLEQHFIEMIDAKAAEMGTTRSAIVRMLIKQSLGVPAVDAAMQEAWFVVQPVFRIILLRVAKSVSEAATEIVKRDAPAIFEQTIEEELERLRSQARGAA